MLAATLKCQVPLTKLDGMVKDELVVWAVWAQPFSMVSQQMV